MKSEKNFLNYFYSPSPKKNYVTNKTVFYIDDTWIKGFVRFEWLWTKN